MDLLIQNINQLNITIQLNQQNINQLRDDLNETMQMKQRNSAPNDDFIASNDMTGSYDLIAPNDLILSALNGILKYQPSSSEYNIITEWLYFKLRN